MTVYTICFTSPMAVIVEVPAPAFSGLNLNSFDNHTRLALVNRGALGALIGVLRCGCVFRTE
jgi:hypothetical protein